MLYYLQHQPLNRSQQLKKQLQRSRISGARNLASPPAKGKFNALDGYFNKQACQKQKRRAQPSSATFVTDVPQDAEMPQESRNSVLNCLPLPERTDTARKTD